MVANYKEACKRLALKRLEALDRMPANKKVIRDFIAKQAVQDGFGGDVLIGLVGNDLKKNVDEKREFIYLDHSYFKRGWQNGYFRACRNWVHQNRLFKRPDDRLERFGIRIQPWRKTGSKVAVIPNTYYQYTSLGGEHWVRDTVARLREITKRPIEVRDKGHGTPLVEYLQDVWAVVTWGSVAGVEAALQGIPVFAEHTCPAYPVSAGPLERIETPEYAENRYEWICSLSYASWHWDEIPKIAFKDYWYQMKEAS